MENYECSHKEWDWNDMAKDAIREIQRLCSTKREVQSPVQESEVDGEKIMRAISDLLKARGPFDSEASLTVGIYGLVRPYLRLPTREAVQPDDCRTAFDEWFKVRGGTAQPMYYYREEVCRPAWQAALNSRPEREAVELSDEEYENAISILGSEIGKASLDQPYEDHPHEAKMALHALLERFQLRRRS